MVPSRRIQRVEIGGAEYMCGRMCEGPAPGQGFLENVIAVAPDLEFGESGALPPVVAGRAAAGFLELVVDSLCDHELPRPLTTAWCTPPRQYLPGASCRSSSKSSREISRPLLQAGAVDHDLNQTHQGACGAVRGGGWPDRSRSPARSRLRAGSGTHACSQWIFRQSP